MAASQAHRSLPTRQFINTRGKGSLRRGWKRRSCPIRQAKEKRTDMRVRKGPYLHFLGLLASHLLLQDCDAAGCPIGWMQYQSYCYGIFADKQDWTQAELNCQNHRYSGHLASILSDYEAQLLFQFITNNFPKEESFWIGLQDRLKNGRWRWSDSATSMFTAWVGGKPKSVDESGFCAYISKKQKFLEWNDAFCSTRMPYICETTM
ncbi:regenerating islet-derived protein 4-like [Heteronotia binoei]|uniref:regenerating islet-derived protein 4-like n=1 Tax=Heteronotia binoei TaxID=13085 RepID=UPI00292E7B81|nr:regenerating islet-derived protein 4-like [Heteronotia binoei]